MCVLNVCLHVVCVLMPYCVIEDVGLYVLNCEMRHRSYCSERIRLPYTHVFLSLLQTAAVCGDVTGLLEDSFGILRLDWFIYFYLPSTNTLSQQ